MVRRMARRLSRQPRQAVTVKVTVLTKQLPPLKSLPVEQRLPMLLSAERPLPALPSAKLDGHGRAICS